MGLVRLINQACFLVPDMQSLADTPCGHPESDTVSPAHSAPHNSNSSAVGSMALCVARVSAAEFMPVSLLTPIASDLHAGVGMAGQAISISGLVAVITSFGIAMLLVSHLWEAARFLKRQSNQPVLRRTEPQ